MTPMVTREEIINYKGIPTRARGKRHGFAVNRILKGVK
jgi:hypothetical protein